jgi:enoyl-CoA hydratase/carnithine racemase
MDIILFNELPAKSGRLGIITLNRPQALNATNEIMLTAMYQQLQDWATRSDISAVIIRSSSEKAFCAGGDVRALYQDLQAGKGPEDIDFFAHEYKLNYLIGTYPKPYICLLNGIVMGGGAGISIHGSHRVGCQSLVFAMPETAIGLFTDIGSSYFFNRMPGCLGRYLALSGARINVADAIYAGIVDYCISSQHFDDVIQSLADAEFSEGSAHETVNRVLEDYAIKADKSFYEDQQTFIDGIFCGETVEAMLDYLSHDDGEWSQAVLAHLAQKSPTSLLVNLELLKRAEGQDLKFCLAQDYTVVQTMLGHHDFCEGVRAVLVDKDMSPQWQPSSIAEMTVDQVKAYFATQAKKSLGL